MKHLFLFLILLSGTMGISQRIVIHTDLTVQSTRNTAYKVGIHQLYTGKLGEIADNRKKTLGFATTIEEIHRKAFNALSNVDNALRNGQTLVYIGKKVPQIFDNLIAAAQMAARKPYLAIYVKDKSEIITQRIAILQAYLSEVLLKDDAKVLMTPTDRDKLVWEVYKDISIIHSQSQAMVSLSKMYTLQDAVNKVVPYQMYYNMDKMLVDDIKRRIKF